MTDTERLDFLDKMMKLGGDHSHFDLDGYHLFTIQTQQKQVSSARHAIDLMEEYESGKRCWKCENWYPMKGDDGQTLKKCPDHREATQ